MRYSSSWDLNNASTYIYITEDAGNKTASGFFFVFDGVNSIFLVTNKHVAMDAKTFTIPLCSSIEDDSFGHITDISKKVIFHPQDDIDLCIVRMDELKFVPGNIVFSKLKMKAIHEDMIISKKEASQLNYCEDIIMFSAPYGVYDTKNNLSVAYKGITATHAGTDLHDGSYFMVDVPSWPGSSGSAIYLCTPETMSSFSNTKLLGIFYKAQYKPNSDPKNEQYIHLGKAIPAYKLLEFKNVL